MSAALDPLATPRPVRPAPLSVALFEPGTRVTAVVGGVRRNGVVANYEPEYQPLGFPVRFENGWWRVMSTSECEVVVDAPPVAANSRRSRPIRSAGG